MDVSSEQRDHFDRVYREHSSAVFEYALRRAASPEGAADATSETFVVAWRHLNKVTTVELPWLYAIARKVLSSQRRSAIGQQRIADRVAHELHVKASPPAAETAIAVRDALEQLTEREREVLMLAAWEGLSSDEGAVVLGCSPTAYRIRLHRARRRLHSRLSESDETPLLPRRANDMVMKEEVP